MYGTIKHYMSTKGEEFHNPIKKDLFIVLCQSVEQIIRGNVSEDFIDTAGIVDDTYNLIYNMFKPLVETNNNLLKELEKQVKYGKGCKIIVDPESLKKLV